MNAKVVHVGFILEENYKVKVMSFMLVKTYSDRSFEISIRSSDQSSFAESGIPVCLPSLSLSLLFRVGVHLVYVFKHIVLIFMVVIC